MKTICSAAFFLSVGMATAAEPGAVLGSLSPEDAEHLKAGATIVLPFRPDEKNEEDRDERFVSVARRIQGARETIWDVIHDKEGAEEFLDGVLESQVLEQFENEIIVEQRTHVGGPKGDYLYTLRHQLTPMERSDFTFVKGEIRNVIGSWWIFDTEDSGIHLVVYSLHIDPGYFALQFVVKRGMKKSMPGTVLSIEQEVKRRSSKPKVEEGASSKVSHDAEADGS